MLRIPRALAIVVAALALSLIAVGCSSGATPPTTTVTASAVTNNDFIPTNQDLSNCVGTLEQPNCGSSNKSDLRLDATFAVLMVGMALIGWRIAIGIRNRDRDEQIPEHTY